MDLRKEAKYYLNKWFSVIPVGKNKIPLINWKEYQKRFPTEEEIDKWFDDFPEAQIWAVTWKISWIVVIDIENWWDTSWVPETATSKTWGGGYHFFYKFSKPFKNKTRIRELTDIRWDGWYVMMPPSVSEKWSYEWIKKVQFQMFPYWLFENDKEVKKEVSKVDSEYAWASEWWRNDSLTRYAWHLVAKVHPTEWEKIVLPLLHEANTKNEPPLPDYEVDAIFTSITSIEKWADNDRWYKNEEQESDDEHNEILPFFESAEKDMSMWLERYSCWFDLFDNALLDDIEKEENPSLIGWMAEWDVTVIWGSTWQWKTELTLTLTYNFASQWIPVLYISYEVLIWYLLNKFKKMWATKDMPIYAPEAANRHNIKWIEEKIVESKNKYWVKVVVVDHLWFVMPRMKVSESGNTDTVLTQILRDFKSIAIKERIIIILPVHLRKTEDPSMNDIKGSSGIAQESDQVFIIEREKNRDDNSPNFYTNHSRIKLEKNRKTGKAVQWWFTLINWRFVHDQFYKLR